MRKLVLLTAFVLGSVGAWAQGVTTSSISGSVRSLGSTQTPERVATSKDVLPGATVIAVHLPSGTQYGTVSRTDGYFNFPAVRTGGPYKITVSFVGYKEQVKENLYTLLGQNLVVNFDLVDDATELQ
ncbi:MAG: carboxypeptidase regulatory-like domain-containing protein, partial [Cytophagia bacterium]|nr:carboxypeptidase regulatory-like domain-containing protein [Cytophagia bacterium]